MKAKLIVDDELEFNLGGKGLQLVMHALANYWPLDIFPSETQERINSFLKNANMRDDDLKALLERIAPYRDLEEHINVRMANSKHYIKVDGKLMNSHEFIEYNKTLPKDKQFNLNSLKGDDQQSL